MIYTEIRIGAMKNKVDLTNWMIEEFLDFVKNCNHEWIFYQIKSITIIL